jgi:hypothetical protein
MKFNKQQAEYLISILEKRLEEVYRIYWDEVIGDWKSSEGADEKQKCIDMLDPLYMIAINPIQVTRTITYGIQGYLEYCADMDRKPSQGDFYDWVEGLVYDDFREPVELDFLTFKEVDSI